MAVKLLILILLVRENTSEHCDVQSEESNKRCFVKQTLATLPHSPNQLAVDKLTNTLYFSFDAGQGEYLPAALQLDTKRLTVLKGVKDAFAMASDEENGEVYFGGSHGIYRYNPTLRTLKRLLVKNLDIWWLVLKKRLYFIRFPSLKAYFYANRSVNGVYKLNNYTVNQFVFDSEDNIFFINGSGLFGIKNNDTSPILLRDYPRFLGMAIDNSSHVYLCSENSIYVISRIVQKVKKIVSVAGVLGICFDRDNNLIYSDSHELVRLMPVFSKN
ncbi:ommochrome-binding protein-like [Zerene cesonia]|uniref:ommochrome-binding protein-like n=1 Tax=Zerene cesonia TaxID=33412 RepID=UPI0018E5021E|nr:ommochrome-binding protein-like [Zerene cesonia]